MDPQTVRAVIGEPEATTKPLNGHSKSPTVQHGEARNHTQTELDPVAVYSCDASGVITYFSDRAVQLWGRRPEIGDTYVRFCGSHKLYRADGSPVPHEQSPMADVLSGRVSGIHDAEVDIERPDGTRVIVFVNIAPLIDDRGVIVGAMSSFHEIAEP